MPAFRVGPNKSPLGKFRSISSASGSSPTGPGALVRAENASSEVRRKSHGCAITLNEYYKRESVTSVLAGLSVAGDPSDGLRGLDPADGERFVPAAPTFVHSETDYAAGQSLHFPQPGSGRALLDIPDALAHDTSIDPDRLFLH